jgi:hypothetical protein
MNRFRILGLSGAMVVAALVGGTVVSSAIAARPSPPSAVAGGPAAGAAAEANRAATGDVAAAAEGAMAARAAAYCKTFRSSFAKELGVDERAIGPAAKAAALATLEAAVTAGDITRAIADRLAAKVTATDDDTCRWLEAKISHAAARPGVHGLMADGTKAAATALKMTPADLRAALRDGKSLKDVATSAGVDYAAVSAAVVAAAKADLDAAVKAGKINQARADRLLERLEAGLANGKLGKSGSR